MLSTKQSRKHLNDDCFYCSAIERKYNTVEYETKNKTDLNFKI
jgi:hypothetical protein